tara:strand:+ start:2555 stop:2908 length:354 start_codon:yes stop_codon:yes gene_type:complete
MQEKALIFLKDRLLIEIRLAFGIDYKEIDMCFGGGGSDPEPKEDEVDIAQKEQEKEEKQKTIQRRQDEKEETIAEQQPIQTSLTYDTGRKVVRGSRGRRALYTSPRGGIGYRNNMLG